MTASDETPVQRAASRLDEQADADLARMNSASKAKRSKANATTKADAPRARFVNVEGEAFGRPGVYWIDVRRDNGGESVEAEPQWICSPIEVVAATRDASGGEWGRLLEFKDRDSQPHRWAMPCAMLAGSGEELRAELLRQGVEITSHPDRRRRLLDYIAWAAPDARARCVTRTGWHGSAFVLPSESFGDAAEPVLFQGASDDAVALACAGTLDAWRAEVAKPCAGNSRLVLAMCAAFAGPCLGLLDAEGGGLHFRGASSSGKSTALALAASVFGPPGFVRTWRATDNALEAIAATHSDLLLALDEIGQLDPKHAGAAAYLLANGQGKSRSTRDGAARAAVRFRVLFVSAGELGLGDLVTAAGNKQRAGEAVRVLDIPAEPHGGTQGIFDAVPADETAGEFADRLKRAAATNHGHALRAWLCYLSANPERARELLRDGVEYLAPALSGGVDAAGQVRRVAAKFALLAAAGELATQQGLTGWPSDEAMKAAQVCFADWLRARGTKGAAEPAAMLAQVRLYLAQHGEARFSPWRDADESHKARTISRVGFRRGREDMTDACAYYVFADAFRVELCAGFDPRQVSRALASIGALKIGSKGEHTRMERLPDGTKARVYVILPEVWERDGEADE